MKIEAKARLAATQITAAPGDAKLIRLTYLKFAPILARADKLFDKFVIARNKDDDDGDEYLEKAGELINDWMHRIDEGSFNKITGLDEFVAEPGEGSHDLYGSMGAEFGHDSIECRYSMDLNDPKKHDVSVCINRKEFTYVWASGKFNVEKYKAMVNKALDFFEKNGFGGK